MSCLGKIYAWDFREGARVGIGVINETSSDEMVEANFVKLSIFMPFVKVILL